MTKSTDDRRRSRSEAPAPPDHRELVERLRDAERIDRSWHEMLDGRDDEIKALQSELAEVKAERDAALRECTTWAREAGLAKGKLDASEMAGVVEGWKVRAERAESSLLAAQDIAQTEALKRQEAECLLAAAAEEIGQASTEFGEAAKIMRNGLGRPMPSLAEVYERASLRAASVHAQIKGAGE